MSLLISNHARPVVQLDSEPWYTPGKVHLPDVRAARIVAWRVNEAIEETRKQAGSTSAGAIRALDLIEEALQRVARNHLETADPTLIPRSLTRLEETIGPDSVDRTLREFGAEYLGGADLSRGESFLELLVFWVVHQNPAAEPIHGVLHQSPLLEGSDFKRATEGLTRWLTDEESGVGEDGETLLDLLLAPQRASPDSLVGQLQHLRQHWDDLLEDKKVDIQAGLDLFAEELAPRFAGGPGPAEAPELDLGEEEPVRYSSDRSWMPRLVLLAKNAYVWLDQLSRRYERELRYLDDIPDEELTRLASHGITGLWLIGVWERSDASKRIKQLCGNPEAVASAYSLKRYVIADALGGERALQNLESRARQHGIRLAADMVPNHMGIDSDWVLNHPDWFLGDSTCPFPSYSFGGPDLSPDPDTGIFLEDHYYDRSDAAVVFKRIDRRTGTSRFIYHGNDGTSTPWNDTAQLDYLQPKVREAVIETILDVARRFPVIRFDAAMTLAKRHIQRLWFPEPGTAGAIPSRSEYGMSRKEFQRRLPEEFWREVVDRVSSELPDTLLLAEAFWLMESYFVRTLGMHRVYNSAFMNMLRDQENAKYRRLLKDTLAFDPQILQRYVNFMSNPDEKTAIEQFGSGDRYFGVCVMMATLPGLPMFAHGQFEGFSEKYGMEYYRAYWDEQPDTALAARHKREIVPLLKRRDLFAGVENFRLYDLVDDGGRVNENVYAYSNGSGDRRVLVLFNNRFEQARGRIFRSAPDAIGSKEGSPRTSRSQTLAAALRLSAKDGVFVTFRDLIGGLEYLADSRDLVERGLTLDLGAFQYRVLTDFETIADDAEGKVAQLARRLGSHGVESLELAQRGLRLEPLREIWHKRIHPALLGAHAIQIGPDEASVATSESDPETDPEHPSETDPEPSTEATVEPVEVPSAHRFAELESALEEIAAAAAKIVDKSVDLEEVERIRVRLATLPAALAESEQEPHEDTTVEVAEILAENEDPEPTQQSASAVETVGDLEASAAIWAVLSVLRDSLGEEFPAPSLIQAWSLGSEALHSLAELGVEPDRSGPLLASVAVGIEGRWGLASEEAPSARDLLAELLADEPSREALQVHTFDGVEYLHRESLQTLLDWRCFLEKWSWASATDQEAVDVAHQASQWDKIAKRVEDSAEEAGYRCESIREFLDEPVAGAKPAQQELTEELHAESDSSEPKESILEGSTIDDSEFE